jgi:hypothetical protein
VHGGAPRHRGPCASWSFNFVGKHADAEVSKEALEAAAPSAMAQTVVEAALSVEDPLFRAQLPRAKSSRCSTCHCDPVSPELRRFRGKKKRPVSPERHVFFPPPSRFPNARELIASRAPSVHGLRYMLGAMVMARPLPRCLLPQLRRPHVALRLALALSS